MALLSVSLGPSSRISATHSASMSTRGLFGNSDPRPTYHVEHSGNIQSHSGNIQSHSGNIQSDSGNIQSHVRISATHSASMSTRGLSGNSDPRPTYHVEHSGNVSGTFRDESETFVGHLGNI
jgi:hypothetical protein